MVFPKCELSIPPEFELRQMRKYALIAHLTLTDDVVHPKHVATPIYFVGAGEVNRL